MESQENKLSKTEEYVAAVAGVAAGVSIGDIFNKTRGFFLGASLFGAYMIAGLISHSMIKKHEEKLKTLKQQNSNLIQKVQSPS